MSPDLRLKPGEEDRLLAGHPWIFRDELASLDGSLAPGSQARLLASDGRPLGWGHVNPRSKIAFRLLSREGPADGAFYEAKLAAALARRTRLYPGEEAYRLCFGESDGLPGLVADRYGARLVVQLLSAGMERDWPLVQAALLRLLPLEGILLRGDSPHRALEGLGRDSRVAFGEIPEEVEVVESGLRFRVPLAGGQKTGWYFDQRENRLWLAPWFKGRRVLDLFCYLGGFALRAAWSGAARVEGADSSAEAVRLARANAELNGLSVRFTRADAAAVLRGLGAGRGPRPELILVDPPNFVRSKAALPAASRAYLALFANALRCLPPGGLLAASTCSRHVGSRKLVGLLREAAAESGTPVELLAVRGQAADHPVHPSMPETAYLWFVLLRVRGGRRRGRPGRLRGGGAA